MAVKIVQWQNFLTATVQVKLVLSFSEIWRTHKLTKIVIIKIFATELLSQLYLATTFNFTYSLPLTFYNCHFGLDVTSFCNQDSW